MLKVGVFGVGHLGKFHLNNWKELENVELVGFYDPSDTTAKEVTEKYGLKRFDTPEELLQLIDAADIVAPTNFHFELCEKAIRKGKHVFVEKPLANTIEEGRQIVKMAREAIKNNFKKEFARNVFFKEHIKSLNLRDVGLLREVWK